MDESKLYLTDDEIEAIAIGEYQTPFYEDVWANWMDMTWGWTSLESGVSEEDNEIIS